MTSALHASLHTSRWSKGDYAANRVASPRKIAIRFAVSMALVVTVTLTTRDAWCGEEARTWKSADGKFSTVAKLVDFTGDSVVLIKEDGVKLTVPFAQLHVADQTYCTQFRARSSVPIPSTSTSPLSPTTQSSTSADGKLDALQRDVARLKAENRLMSEIDSVLQSNEFFDNDGAGFAKKMRGLGLVELGILPSDPAKAAELVARLRHDKTMAVRKEVARLLGLSNVDEAEPILLEMTKDNRREVQAEAKAALLVIGPIPDEVLKKREELKRLAEVERQKTEELEKSNGDVMVEAQRYIDAHSDRKTKQDLANAVIGLKNVAIAYNNMLLGKSGKAEVHAALAEIRKRNLTSAVEAMLREGGIGNYFSKVGDKIMAWERIYEEALKL